MKKILFVTLSFLLSACSGEDLPDYVLAAKQDIETAVRVHIVKNTDINFKCDALKNNETEQWTLGCFPRKQQSGFPAPFLLFSITKDLNQTNPPFKYKLNALNGKAAQYASNPGLKMFKITHENDSTIDINKIISKYLNLLNK